MGGSGSGSASFGRGGEGGGGGAGPGPKGGLDCFAFTAKTTLRSPKKDVVAQFEEGDQLGLMASNRSLPIVAANDSGQIAGSVVLPNQDQLLKCINKGVPFVAEVVRLEGGSCIVEIYAVESD